MEKDITTEIVSRMVNSVSDVLVVDVVNALGVLNAVVLAKLLFNKSPHEIVAAQDFVSSNTSLALAVALDKEAMKQRQERLGQTLQ